MTGHAMIAIDCLTGHGIGHRSSMKVIRNGLDNEIGQKARSRPEYYRLYYQVRANKQFYPITGYQLSYHARNYIINPEF